MGVKATKQQPEAAFRRRVMQLAQTLGWRVVHWKTSLNQRGVHLTAYEGDGRGHPDLMFCPVGRPGVVTFAELKAGKNTADAHQRAWLADLRAAGCPAYLWYDTDADWAEIQRVLA